MGGVPFLALNIAALPPDLPPEISSEILRGGAEKCKQAGVIVAGGHTVQDKEPKYGLVALGFVHPKKMLTKSGVQLGDVLVLTKPLGFGVTTTAIKRGLVSEAELVEVTGWMSRLNQTAGQLANEFNLRGGTDITGFGLLGHGLEMARASGLGFRLHYRHLPFITCARKFAEEWTFPGGTSDNRNFYGSQVHFEPGIHELEQMLAFDAQTSGGLLLAVPPEKMPAFEQRARELGQPVWVVGEALEGQGIEVLR
jgi:selenide,water dikinase